ncbi:hypothetical protein E3E36_10070 [Thermococcus sp. M36]|uniref:hypothetical protein n=1 Tax=Thermococcus sp. M36 TaxID=1638261 RepID=UPI00143C8780|nr:hypothetical protein [Thermococcus sp. M36]NJE06480.1 hypothetical protein [Thermococcus sp. M36]
MDDEIIVTYIEPDVIVSETENIERPRIKKKRAIQVPYIPPVFLRPNTVASHIEEAISPPEPFDISKVNLIGEFVFLESGQIKSRSLEIKVFRPYVVHLIDMILRKNMEVHFEKPSSVSFSVTDNVRTPSGRELNPLSFPVFSPIFLKPSGDIGFSVTTEVKLLIATKSPKGVPEIELPVEDMILRAFGTSAPFFKEGPVIILAKKPESKRFGYIEFLKRLLREVYRIRAGGLPVAYHVLLPGDPERLRSIKAGNSIFVLEWEGRTKPEEKLKDYQLIIIEKVRELFSQGFGFLVFYGNDDFLEWVRTKIFVSRKATSNLNGNTKLSLVPRWIELGLKSPEDFERLIEHFWGFYEELSLENEGFDYLVSYFEGQYHEFMEGYVKTINIRGKTVPSALYIEGNAGESLIHYALKAFVFERLVEDYGVNPEDIETEYPEGDIRIDVYIKTRDTAIEVETFYGETIPLLKLRKDVETRLNTKSELWIVLPPSSYLLFKNDVQAFIKWTSAEPKYRNRVKIFTVDIKNKKLVQIT